MAQAHVELPSCLVWPSYAPSYHRDLDTVPLPGCRPPATWRITLTVNSLTVWRRCGRPHTLCDWTGTGANYPQTHSIPFRPCHTRYYKRCELAPLLFALFKRWQQHMARCGQFAHYRSPPTPPPPHTVGGAGIPTVGFWSHTGVIHTTLQDGGGA